MRYLLLILTMPFWVISAFSQELPDAIKGKWQVAEVHINTESPRTPFYAWNDPRLVGRLFTFDKKAITNDTFDYSECITPSVRTTSIRFQELISKSMAGYGHPSKNATARDYRLDVGQAENTKVIQIYCNGSLWNEDLGLDDGVRGSWLFFANADQILLRWRDESILILDRLTGSQKPNPSFDCSKSITKAEGEICSSIELSAFDRSVSQAYKLVLSQYRGAGNDSRALTLEQKTWLAKRDKCGVDRNCLVSSMRKRLDELSTPSQ
ncbi:lysozyme inhibitor LprI family protein [Burkholderia sp. LMG 32019]|uniref:lysozyme inhibitor LprI family protein n=1 Tax=Burkholderia sp. LMG 32019 TaxID=3158173 RepID=UPI003C2D69F7